MDTTLKKAIARMQQTYDRRICFLQNQIATVTANTNTTPNTGTSPDLSVVSQSMVTGGTVTAGVSIVVLNPPAVLASASIALPSLVDKQVFRILFGGTIAVGSPVVTALTIVPPNGVTIYQATVPATAVGGDILTYIFESSTSLLRRI